MVVLKFGGSSVATGAAITRVVDIVAHERRPRAVVVSALGGVTDQLIEAARLAGTSRREETTRLLDQLRARHRTAASAIESATRRAVLLDQLDETWAELLAFVRAASRDGSCSPARRDAIVASGELLSSRIVTAFLAERGVPAAWIDARRVIVTDARHGEAGPDADATRTRVRAAIARLEAGTVPVVGGFVGATPEGATTTLGRGGSDYSASLIGASLDAVEIQIWTDTDGVLTADPRVLPQAQTVTRLSYGEAAALAYFGAKVLHPATVAPAVATGIPLRVLNSQRPDAAGTLITAGHGHRAAPLAGIAWRTGLNLITIELGPTANRAAALAQVTGACAGAGVTVHQTSVSDTGIGLVVDATPSAVAIVESAGALGRVECHDRLASVAAVGDALSRSPELSAAVLRAIGPVPLQCVTQTPGASHLSVVLGERRLQRVLTALHERFFERDEHREQPGAELPDGAGPATGRFVLGQEAWA
jgi:aspartate kinase